MDFIFILLAIASILFLVVLHELGHFLTARMFGIKAEEFGIGMPFTPALFKKKIGETVYSFYPVLIGAFVRLLGEEKEDSDPRSFSNKPVWKRLVVVGAGVVSSWLIAIVILGFLGATWGIPAAIGDTDAESKNAQIQITAVQPESPAARAGLQMGDIAVGAFPPDSDEFQEFSTVNQTIEFINSVKGQETVFIIQRVDEEMSIPITPRVETGPDEGALGIGLNRVGYITFPWYEAPVQGVILTGTVSWNVTRLTVETVQNALQDEGPPLNEQVAGPVGIVSVLQDSLSVGIANFLFLVALIAIYLAIFNTIPIPALDGGRMLFLAIEGVIGRPVPAKLVQTLIIISFLLLVPLIIWATVNDIQRIF